MMRRWRFGVAAVLALGVAPGGCSWLGGGEEEEPAQAPAPGTAPLAEPVSVQAVRHIEIGRTRRGYAITAYGTAPGLGHANPRLVARRGGAPADDGMLDYDFLLDQPPPGLALPQGTARARAVRADLEIPADRLEAVRGLRVHAVSGGVQMLF